VVGSGHPLRGAPQLYGLEISMPKKNIGLSEGGYPLVNIEKAIENGHL